MVSSYGSVPLSLFRDSPTIILNTGKKRRKKTTSSDTKGYQTSGTNRDCLCLLLRIPPKTEGRVGDLGHDDCNQSVSRSTVLLRHVSWHPETHSDDNDGALELLESVWVY